MLQSTKSLARTLCNTASAPNDSVDESEKQQVKHKKPIYRHEDRDGAWHKPEGLDTGIKMFNSVTRRKEALILPRGRIATWYSCGPTVYDHAHIGHARFFLF